MARDDDETEIRREPDRWVTPDDATYERVEAPRETPPPPLPPGGSEIEEEVVYERQTIRHREDGAIETDTVRQKQRRRSTGTPVAQNPVGGQAQQGSTVRLNVSRGR